MTLGYFRKTLSLSLTFPTFAFNQVCDSLHDLREETRPADGREREQRVSVCVVCVLCVSVFEYFS